MKTPGAHAARVRSFDEKASLWDLARGPRAPPGFRRRKDEHIMAGPEVGLTRVAKAARLYLDRRPDAVDWHRGDDRDVQRSQRCVTTALALWGRNARCCPMANQFEKRRRARGDFARQFF